MARGLLCKQIMHDSNNAPRFGHNEWRLAYAVALRVRKSPDQAEDAAQDAMIRAYRARDSFSGTARFESWLYRIAFTTALSHLRKPHYRARSRQVVRDVSGRDPLYNLPANDETPAELAVAGELAHCMEGCLDGMRPLDRLAFTERFLRGTSERELGELLGVSTNAAKQRAFRARRTLRQCVTQAGLNPRAVATEAV